MRATALGEQPFGCCKAFRAGAAAARGSRPPRGSASCSNTRARYIRAPHKRDPLGRNPLAATSFAGRGVLVSLGHSNSKSSAQRRCPCSTKPRASTWRKTRWCGDRAQAGHGWPAFACWSQGRRNQAMRPIPAPPRLPPKPVDSSAFQAGRIRHPAAARTSKKTGPAVPRPPAPGFPIARMTGPCSNSSPRPPTPAAMGAREGSCRKRANSWAAASCRGGRIASLRPARRPAMILARPVQASSIPPITSLPP